MLNKLLKWWYGDEPQLTPVQEAREQRLAKDSKLQTGMEAVFVNSLNQIDKSEREAVNEYRNRQMGAPPKPPHGKVGGESGDGLIIADDIQTTNIDRRGLGPVATVILVVALCILAYLLAVRSEPSEASTTTTTIETDYRVDSSVIEP